MSHGGGLGQGGRNDFILRNLVVIASILHKSDEEVDKYLGELEALNPEDSMVTTAKNLVSRVQQLEKEYL